MNNPQQVPLNPLRKKPAMDSAYWYPDLKNADLISREGWADFNIDRRLLALGICFETPQEAAECARRMLAAIKVESAP